MLFHSYARTRFLGLPNNSQVIQVRGAAAPQVFQLELLVPVFLCFITMDNDVIYNLTVRQNVISRYVKVMQAVRLFSSRFMRIKGHFQL